MSLQSRTDPRKTRFAERSLPAEEWHGDTVRTAGGSCVAMVGGQARRRRTLAGPAGEAGGRAMTPGEEGGPEPVTTWFGSAIVRPAGQAVATGRL